MWLKKLKNSKYLPEIGNIIGSSPSGNLPDLY